MPHILLPKEFTITSEGVTINISPNIPEQLFIIKGGIIASLGNNVTIQIESGEGLTAYPGMVIRLVKTATVVDLNGFNINVFGYNLTAQEANEYNEITAYYIDDAWRVVVTKSN